MRLIAFALGLFAFVAVFLLVLRYTTHLSNVKKGRGKHPAAPTVPVSYDSPMTGEDL
ncbi:hypothetical protein [Alicyclobacillus shizuokensis]|uniref:hypothetical protein n=1 Tax=Alicyclobacillus shizuokensis TaxID=392014 RepID=UPI000AD27E70|nr:hypothetical protein [Alicyclobacillus shizuokensis]MCL6625299.1 hypothetical protein [Alicyclobacillus shizuokensis]